MGVETGFPPKLPSLAIVNLVFFFFFFFTNAGVPLPSLLVLPPRQGGDAPGVDLVASQIDVQFFTINPLPDLPPPVPLGV